MRATKLMGSDFPNSTIDSRVITRCLNLQTPGSAYNIRRKVNDLMRSKSRVKLSRNTGASVTTQAVSLRRNTCGICRKAVVDGKDDALFCEGHCQRWLHRVCASVTKEQDAKLAASEQPFLCPTCCQAHNLQQIAELTSTVDALKLELEQLKQVVQKQMEKQPQPQRAVPISMPTSSSSPSTSKPPTSQRQPMVSLSYLPCPRLK